MMRMIDLNVTALTRLTYAAIPGFVARGKSAVINISSIVAISPKTLNGVFGSSKAFVLAFSQSLHHELADKSVQMEAVLPGATATDFWQIAGLPVKHLPEGIVMSASDMVDAALTGFALSRICRSAATRREAGWLCSCSRLLLLETLSGLYVYNEVADEGPLSEWVPAWIANAPSTLHAVVWNVLLAAVAMHVLVIALYAVVKGHNLLRPMLSGYRCYRLRWPRRGGASLARAAAARDRRRPGGVARGLSLSLLPPIYNRARRRWFR